MNDLIRKLKRLVSELESYDYCNNLSKVEEIAGEIAATASMIQNDNHNMNITSDFKKISKLQFIYKPVTVINYYDGDYLERFSEQRTRELKSANVLELHDKFWTSNNVERGNIFGSIPTELIPKNSVDELLYMGWELTDVIVYEVDNNMDLSDIAELCTIKFKYYIVATEKRDNSILVLHYDIR